MIFVYRYFIVTFLILIQIKAQAFETLVRVRTQRNPEIIQSIPMTDYLAGVVSKEMPLAWPEEALKAQAVVARSYLISKMQERANKSYHLEADQMDQVFAWTNSEKAYRVVRETKGIVLAQNKKVVRSYYHADCGGQTIPAGKVWYGAMDLGTAVDPWCARRTQNQWEHSVPLSFFESKETYTAAYFRNKIVRFENDGIQKIRQLFGFSKIRNSPETVEVSESEVTFKGRGFGHGVGLCQWGSLYMARKGRGYLDILTHYYPKAEIININTLEFKNYLTNSENPKTISRR